MRPDSNSRCAGSVTDADGRAGDLPGEAGHRGSLFSQRDADRRGIRSDHETRIDSDLTRSAADPGICIAYIRLMRALLVEDDLDHRRLRRPGAARGRLRRRSRGRRRRRAAARRRASPYDVAIVDVMLPELDGLVADQGAAPAPGRHARADPQRAAHGRRPRQRPRSRRRRLPDQAVRLRRAARARPGADPPRHRRAGVDPRSLAGDLTLDLRSRRAVARPAATSSCGRASSRCSNT